ncbi:sensor domain-containing diguanylate cyclase/phosphohydrolase [Rhodopirellula sp. P2]|uniref:sensor domain-containing diguanylate cyclase/phosphohydrolase n=1 Tax=Rhodopirellula sp. P2 TaxID=2127060 RepID=UPI00236839CE|nr:diguanylate cyclase [Rhodopirellula sp. P2]WDQ19195.1 diguanylate cyclase [Rhodopirellula sp. P2]
MNDQMVPSDLANHSMPPMVPVPAGPPAADVPHPDVAPIDPPQPDAVPPDAAQSASRLSELLMGLGEAATGQLPGVVEPASAADAIAQEHAGDSVEDTRPFENHLAMVRLGMATSLFYALRTKHAPTAAHSLRVALACSAWCERLGLADEARDRIEVAALLHDIGKIGIPDRILRKPGKLSIEEQLTMDCCAELGCEILRGCTTDQNLLNIVKYCGVWYDSRRQEDHVRGDALPLGARMMSIAGAFDAMTTDQVYRSALSRERALQELFRGSGTQFDPELTRDFATMLERRPELLHSSVVDRWLQKLNANSPHFLGQSTASEQTVAQEKPAVQPESKWQGETSGAMPFYQALGDQVRDGVAFTDCEGQVTYWNETLSRLTGVASEAMVGRHWDVNTLGIVDESGDETTSCPVADSLRLQTTVTRTMKLVRGGVSQDVLLQVSPVRDSFGGGALVLVRDMSDQNKLQSQIQSLHKKATSDPLTGIANRAEFDSRLLRATADAKKNNSKFSLIICDIDHFKQVNDVHGHPAGDEALMQFARILESHARNEDLVARYGGEEFVFLAINSDNSTAARRAEQIRQAIEVTPLDGLNGDSVTVSFGVTEYQTGDAAETILARSDRALLKAKENGRNRVVQLGTGIHQDQDAGSKPGWFSWLTSSKKDENSDYHLVTPVPIDLAVEKLRGFISDHRAEIIQVTGSVVSLRIVSQGGKGRRAADHQMTLHVLIQLSEGRGRRNRNDNTVTQTSMRVTIQPIRNRDRRSRDLQPCVREVLGSLKSYLMAEMVQNSDD